MKECKHCKKELTYKQKVYCSRECQYNDSKGEKVKRIECVCLFCDKKYLETEYRLSINKGKYCSRKCKDNHQKEIYLGSNNPSFGRNISSEELIYRSDFMKNLWKSDDFKNKVKEGYKKFINEKGYYPGQDEKSINKRKETIILKYGVPHNWCGIYGKRDCDLTCIKLYGKTSLEISNNFFRNTQPELLFEDILKNLNFDYSKQLRIHSNSFYKIYDFYLPKYNILIEVDGDYWHGNPTKFKVLNEQQMRIKINDEIKNKLAIEHGHQLIRFWEYDIKNNKNIIEDKLKELK